MVRPMFISDIPRLKEMVKKTGNFSSNEVEAAVEQMEVFTKQAAQNDYELVVVEGEEAEIVGYMSFGPAALTSGGYFLYWIAVDPRYAQLGYGTELISWLERRVRSLAGRWLLIETSSQPSYAPARRFYQRLGYRMISRIRDYYKPGDDRVTFVKYFSKDRTND